MGGHLQDRRKFMKLALTAIEKWWRRGSRNIKLSAKHVSYSFQVPLEWQQSHESHERGTRRGHGRCKEVA